jgi:hypothetical protein
MATKEDSQDTGSVEVTMPPLQPSNIAVWFALLETQLDAAGVTSDKVRFATLAKSLDTPLLQQVESVLTNPPATGRYQKLKCELIRILTDSEGDRVKKLVESQEMGDRKPSQFYQHLRKLASPSTPEEFVRSLWRNRLPARIRRILAAVDDTDPDKLMRAADLIAEEFKGEPVHTPQVEAITNHPTRTEQTEAPWLAMFNTFSDQMNQLRAEMKAMNINHTPRRPWRPRRRSRSRSNERTRRSGLCYYHEVYRERARKCQSPCKWKPGNAANRQ